MPGVVFKIKPPTRVAQKAPRAQEVQTAPSELELQTALPEEREPPAAPPVDTVRTQLLEGMISGAHPAREAEIAPISEGSAIEEAVFGDTTAQASGDIAAYAYREVVGGSFHQGYFSPAWNNNAFKYLSIDGLRYSQSIIVNQAVNPGDDAIFFLTEDGSLGISLEETFEMEVTFYPPNESGHETFEPFDIVVVNRESEAVCREHVAKRMQKYKVAK